MVRAALVLLLAGLATGRVQDRDATLWVEVVSADTGAPLAGQCLVITRRGRRNWEGESVSAMEGGIDRFPETDEHGRARFRLPPRAYTLHVRWEEGAPARREVEVAELAPGEVRTLRVELPTEPDVPFHGRLVEEGSGAPLAGADVLLFEAGTWGKPWPIYQPSEVLAELARTTTDGEGRFEVVAPSWKSAMVRVSAAGHAPAFVPVEPGHACPEDEVVLPVGGSGVLIATVQQGGRPVPGIQVNLLQEGAGLIRHAPTDEDGRCRFGDVPAGIPLQVRLDRPSPEDDWNKEWFEPRFPWQRLWEEIPEPLLLASGETREETWQLGATCTVRGIVRDADGRPVPGLTLELIRMDERREEPLFIGGWMTKSPDLVDCDAEGRFVLPDLPGGAWWIGPVAGHERNPNQEAAPFAKRFIIPPQGTALDLELTVHLGLYVRGRVLDALGRPAGGARIRCREPRTDATADADGSFVLGPLIPGEYELTAGLRGNAQSLPVVCRPDEPPVELHLRPAGRLLVLAVDAAGNASHGARVCLYREGSERGLTAAYTPDTDGTCRRDDLLGGTYTLVGRDGDRIGRLDAVEIVPHTSTSVILVVADLAATLRVRHEDPELPFGELFVTQGGSTVGWRTLSAGRTTELTVPAGACQLLLRERDGARCQTLAVEAVAGVATDVVFPRRRP